MMLALDEADEKTDIIQRHIDAILQTHQDTCEQLEELQGLLHEVRSSQNTVRSSASLEVGQRQPPLGRESSSSFSLTPF
jgi:hypothetical protein